VVFIFGGSTKVRPTVNMLLNCLIRSLLSIWPSLLLSQEVMEEGIERDAEGWCDRRAFGARSLAFEAIVIHRIVRDFAESDVAGRWLADGVRAFFDPNERRADEEVEVGVKEDLLEHRELASEGYEVELHAGPPVDASGLAREILAARQVQAVGVRCDALGLDLLGEIGVERRNRIAAPAAYAEPIQEVES
jgi:hypothetical protein